MKKKILSVVLVILLCIGLIPNTADAAVKISKNNIVLYVGETANLKITGTKNKVTWTSSKKSVATVSSTGKVTAKGIGSATVTAKVDSKKYTCKVKVEEDKEITLTVTKMFNFDGFSDYLSKLDMKTVENEDFTTTYKMKKSTQKAILSYISKHFSENNLSEMPAYYKSIDINSDMTEIKATVNKGDYLKNKGSDPTALGFVLMSIGYQQFSGTSDKDIEFNIKFIDKDTEKVIESLNTSDFKK